MDKGQFDIVHICNQRMAKRNPLFNEFAIFFIIFSIFPYLIWKNTFGIDCYILKFIGGSMCIILFTKELWSHPCKKYFAIFWYLCVFISLPLTHLIILFQNNFLEWTLVNFIFSIFILSFIVDWDIFLSFIIFALFISAIYVSVFFKVNFLALLYTTQGMWFIYSLLFYVTISFVFIRNNEIFYDLSLSKAKQSFGIISHEIKNPLASLQLLNEDYKNQDINDSDNSKKEFLHQSDLMIKDIYYILDNILIKLQADKKLLLRRLSILKELTKIMENYPFKDNEKSTININLENDFEFAGESRFFKFLMFNILNNSLVYRSWDKDFYIKIYSEIENNNNILVVEDNGPGMSEKEILLVFNGFYTNKTKGTGLGMFFCKKVMAQFKGDVICESQLGKYTKFKLIFPIIEE